MEGVAYITDPLDILYLTGHKLSRGKLFLYGEKMKLFVDSRYVTATKADLDNEENIEKFLRSLTFDTVYFNPEIPYSQYTQLEKTFRGKKLVAKNCLQERRMIKTKDEITKMEESASLNWKGLCHLKKIMEEGVSEKDLAWEFEKFCRERGASKMAFEPIVAFGANSAMPHHRASKSKLKKNDAVTIDVGIIFEGYCSDLTRSFFFGTPLSDYEELEGVVLEAHEHALALTKPGVKLTFLDEEVRKIFRHHGMEKAYKHNLGHSLGLEVHEFPTIGPKAEGAVLKEGMAVTIEPGLYFEGKWGYRHEDTIVITKNGYRNFYESRNRTR